MRFAAALFTAVCAAAQTASPAPAILSGNLLEWEVSKSAGEISVRSASYQVFRFTFDAKTYFEREQQRISAENLHKGDLLEVVSDAAPGTALRYARTVHVVERRPPLRPLSIASRAWRSSLDQIMPLGSLTLSGVVCRLDGPRMVLHTRRDGDKTVLLREDTRYLDNGAQVAASALVLNLRVFVRGSRNFEDDIEAYQVVWGEILDPAPRR